MPAYTYQTNQLVSDAYKLIGQIDENDILSNNMLQDGISYLNKILSVDEKNGVGIPFYKFLFFDFVPNQQTYEFSLSDDADVSTEPIRDLESIQVYLTSNTIYPLKIYNRDQYFNTMRYENTTGQPIEAVITYAVNKTSITFWPNPNQNWECRVSCKTAFELVEQNQTLNVEPYMLEYLEYALAFKLSRRYKDTLWDGLSQQRLEELKKTIKASKKDLSIQPSSALLGSTIYPIANNLRLP